MIQVVQPALQKFLEAENGMLFGKGIEIRDAIKDWLAYIPQSFHITPNTLLNIAMRSFCKSQNCSSRMTILFNRLYNSQLWKPIFW